MNNDDKSPIEGKIDDTYLVVKSNELVEKSYKLTAREQKIILILASNIKVNDNNFRKVKFKVSDIAERLGIESNSVYYEMQVLTRSLIGKVIEIKVEENGKRKETLQMSWLSSAMYKHGNGVVEFEFSERLMPYLLELKKHFTSYRLGNIVKLNSSYSIRIYELLKQYEVIGEREFLVKDLKYYLGIETTQYRQYGHFKERVILAAQRELAQKTDIRFDFEEKKLEGRSVSHVRFIIFKNIPQEQIQNANQQQPSLFENIVANNESHNLVDELISYGITKKQAAKFVKSYSEEVIRRNIDYALDKNNTGSVNVLGAFIYEAIENDYAQKPAFLEEQKKKQQQEEEEKKKIEQKKKEELKKMEVLKGLYEDYKDKYLADVSEEQMKIFKTTWLEKIVPGNPIIQNMVNKFKSDFENQSIRAPFRKWLFDQLKFDGFLKFEDWALKIKKIKIKSDGKDGFFITD